MTESTISASTAAASRLKIYVLDTNVLIDDPSALFQFQEHDLFLPTQVLEELDHNKEGRSDKARNVRQALRFINDLTIGKKFKEIEAGIPITPISTYESDNITICSGRLFLETNPMGGNVNNTSHSPDNIIMQAVLNLISQKPKQVVILVSNDINFRIKAAANAIEVEHYNSDQTIEDANLMYKGYKILPADFWKTHSIDASYWEESGKTLHTITGPGLETFYPELCLQEEGDEPLQYIVRKIAPDYKSIVAQRLFNYAPEKEKVWGVNPRNDEQNSALNLLLDPEIHFVSLAGQAGTGKTLLALAAGLHQVLDKKLYREIIMTRDTVTIGEDIGFLPGTEEEKMAPWMGALMDNLEVLCSTTDEGGEWGKQATNDFLSQHIKIRSLNFMRGRTFLNRYIILDEAQNLTPKQMKTLISRAGPGTKIVCLGNVAQIDSPYLTETTSGLTYVVEQFKLYPRTAHITLQRGERSYLADLANDVL